MTSPVTKDPSKAIIAKVEAAFVALRALFPEPLPDVVLTLHRQRNAYGYFAARRYKALASTEMVAHEIALNPDTFAKQGNMEILSTLAHEMAHLWQHEHGKPSRTGYHNHEWAARMLEIGLKPVNVEQPSRQTGPKCSHTIIEGGRFEQLARSIIDGGFDVAYFSVPQLSKSSLAKRKRKYVCLSCGATVWGKPGLNLRCADCRKPMDDMSG
jgi:predicted SprT family Zn-dependent metalloprotease